MAHEIGQLAPGYGSAVERRAQGRIDSSMTVLTLSLLALAVGPLAHRLATRASWALALLDGFVLTGVGGLVLLNIWPESLAAGGWLALLGAGAGILAPVFLERWIRREDAARRTTVLLAAIGLAVHAFLDGLALPGPGGAVRSGAMLPVAVVLHRIPVGLAVWWMLRPVVGVGGALGMLILVGGATVAGFGLAHTTIATAFPVEQVATFQAFVAGALLHVLFEHPASESSAPEHRRAATVGALLAAGSLLVLTETHPPVHGAGVGAGSAFLGLALEVAPLLVASLLVAGLLSQVLPALVGSVRGSGRAFGSVAGAACLGLFRPEGHPPGHGARDPAPRSPATWALGLAASSLGPAALLISLPLLGPGLTALRVAGAALLALVTGLVARVLTPETSGTAGGADPGEAGPWLEGVARTADELLPWILAGLGAATFLEPLLSPAWLAAIPAGLDVLLGAAAGLPVLVSSAAATPVVAVMLHKGLSPGAALAFLLTAPTVSVGGLARLGAERGWRMALAVGASVTGLAVMAGFGTNALVPTAQPPQLHALGPPSGDPMGLACLVLLGLVTLVTILRLGPHGFVGRVVRTHPPGAGHD